MMLTTCILPQQFIIVAEGCIPERAAPKWEYSILRLLCQSGDIETNPGPGCEFLRYTAISLEGQQSRSGIK
jgi:hypothetical protein